MVKVIHCERNGGLPIIDCGKDGVGHGVVGAGVVKLTNVFEIKARWSVAESVSEGAGDKVGHEVFIRRVFEAGRDDSGKTYVVGPNNNGGG